MKYALILLLLGVAVHVTSAEHFCSPGWCYRYPSCLKPNNVAMGRKERHPSKQCKCFCGLEEDSSCKSSGQCGIGTTCGKLSRRCQSLCVDFKIPRVRQFSYCVVEDQKRTVLKQKKFECSREDKDKMEIEAKTKDGIVMTAETVCEIANANRRRKFQNPFIIQSINRKAILHY